MAAFPAAEPFLLDRADTTSRLPYAIPNCGRDELADWFAEWGFTTGVEIGVQYGHYSATLCRRNPALHLACVDPWQPYAGYGEVALFEEAEAILAKAIHRLAPYKTVLLRSFSVQAAQAFGDQSLDFVYIDGNHQYDYVLDDLRAWVPKVRPGGVIAGHDYVRMVPKPDQHWQVIQALAAYTAEHAIHPWFVLGRQAKIPGEVREEYRSWLWVQH